MRNFLAGIGFTIGLAVALVYHLGVQFVRLYEECELDLPEYEDITF